MESLRVELKEWEYQFSSKNGGQKPSRKDIKSVPEIAAKYKQYHAFRQNKLPATQEAVKRPRTPERDESAKRLKGWTDEVGTVIPSNVRGTGLIPATPPGTPVPWTFDGMKVPISLEPETPAEWRARVRGLKDLTLASPPAPRPAAPAPPAAAPPPPPTSPPQSSPPGPEASGRMTGLRQAYRPAKPFVLPEALPPPQECPTPRPRPGRRTFLKWMEWARAPKEMNGEEMIKKLEAEVQRERRGRSPSPAPEPAEPKAGGKKRKFGLGRFFSKKKRTRT
ncbi:MAG: hypothetical protein M1825_000624 [Sarcosagium campestre]|nr:MAG: hypothetical protein M1825_000624 [Sarcosagium campestre]